MSVDQRFEAAVETLKSFTKRPSDTEFLELYGLYKQITAGDINKPRPGMMDLRAKAKWDSWKSREGMSKDAAKEAYAKHIDTLSAKYK
ncbi:acyl-CoA-binding protein homolog [Hylaeus volcanicus]|uniref:acyl-CoA-binding protein homolog n=1 Tax=Hylaeus volcanicus TaxID=313075 RepID=UPI0023B781CD|nr:acyl-CoA-binding protein homolog [Hylaeus volcanicus]